MSQQEDRMTPIWVRQWHGREQMAALLDVSIRTLQRRVRSGDIEVHEVPGQSSSYRLCDTPWTHQQIATWALRQQGGDKGATEGRHVARQGATGGDRGSSEACNKRVVTGATGGDNIVAATKTELDDVRSRLERLEQRMGTQDNPKTQREESSTEEPQEAFVWWRVLIVSLLMRLKLWIDRVLERVSSSASNK